MHSGTVDNPACRSIHKLFLDPKKEKPPVAGRYDISKRFKLKIHAERKIDLRFTAEQAIHFPRRIKANKIA